MCLLAFPVQPPVVDEVKPRLLHLELSFHGCQVAAKVPGASELWGWVNCRGETSQVVSDFPSRVDLAPQQQQQKTKLHSKANNGCESKRTLRGTCPLRGLATFARRTCHRCTAGWTTTVNTHKRRNKVNVIPAKRRAQFWHAHKYTV